MICLWEGFDLHLLCRHFPRQIYQPIGLERPTQKICRRQASGTALALVAATKILAGIKFLPGGVRNLQMPMWGAYQP